MFKTNGTEEVYDPQQAKTVDPFLAYTPGGIVNSVSNLIKCSRVTPNATDTTDKTLLCELWRARRSTTIG